jgi:membrane fusion protein, multidrug efflux system
MLRWERQETETGVGQQRKLVGARFFAFLRVSGAGWLSMALVGCTKPEAKPAPAPPKVQVVSLKPRDVPIYQEWIGTVEGYVNAQIRAQVAGYLLSQKYEEGTQVKRGQLLFQIDPRPFEAVVAQAEAKLAQDQAQRGKTKLDVERLTPLAKVKAVSQEELDNAIQANLAQEALLKADQAAIQTAQLNLGFTKVLAPIDGLAGIAQAQIGDLVGPTGTALTTISTIDPVKVNFNVSEQNYLRYRRQHSDPAERAVHEQELQLNLLLADGSVYPRPGKFSFAGREVNPTTGTLLITALFPNPDFVLRPGQFARVKAMTEMRHGAVALPQRAVEQLQGSYQVAVVGSSNRVHIQPVKVGPRIGSDWVIDEGLKPGETVIAEGSQKVKEGMVVSPQPFVEPASTNHASSLAATSP